MLTTPLLTTPVEGVPVQLFQRHRCCGIRNTTHRIVLLLNQIDKLSALQKATLINRFVDVVESFRGRAIFYAWMFHCGRFIVTTGSLIVPALLSIQYTGQNGTPQKLSYDIYWVTWCVSLLVTACNAILTLVKVDKKYYFLNTVVEQISSEAWQYLYLTGKYGGYYIKGTVPSHENQYIFFSHNLEKLKLKQVEEEFFKLQDHHGDKTHVVDSGANTGTPSVGSVNENGSAQSLTKKKSMIAGLYSPTPQQIQLDTIQRQLAEALSPPQVDGGAQPPQNQTPLETNARRSQGQIQDIDTILGRTETSFELPI
jgi:hypothetical protein